MLIALLAACSVVDGLAGRAGPDGPRGPEGWGPPDTGVEGLGAAPGEGFPFDRPGHLFEVALDLPPASVDALERGGPEVPATVRLEGLSAPAGARLKGSSTFDDLDGKPSIKLDFGAFTPGARFLGLERLTLNAMKFDPTMLREATAYRLFAELGVPAPRHGFVRLRINGEDYGVYSAIETLDENFLDRAFPGDDAGHLYDSTFIAADLTGLGLAAFELQEGDPATAEADLRALREELDAGPILEVIERRFDAEAFFAFLAVDLVSPNWDGYARNTNNFLLYHAPLADRWFFVPWGQDTAFRGGGMLWAGVRGRMAAACQADADCRARAEAACRATLETWEAMDLHGYAAGLAAAVGPACAEDPRRSGDCEQEDHLEVLRDRPAEVRRELP